jgi:hypothetical protein
VKDFLETQTQHDLFERLGRLVCAPPLQIRLSVVGSNEPIATLAAERAPFPMKIRQRGDFSLGTFDYPAGQLRLNGQIYFCRADPDKISYVISVCSGTVWERAISRMLHALYPAVAPVFLSQKELISLLHSAKAAFPGGRLRIIGHSRKKRLKTGTRRKFESSRTRTEKPLELVFKEAEEQNFWFESVSFDYHREGIETEDPEKGLPSATISKYGTFFCTFGFDRFRYAILPEMTEIAARKMEFFANRSRRTTEKHKARPISISFDSTAFRNADDNKNFIGILRKMPGTTCAILHGNPYVHLFLRDGFDNSGTDVWVLKDDQVLLIPQLRASEAALKRLVNYIFEEWREGQITSPM